MVTGIGAIGIMLYLDTHLIIIVPIKIPQPVILIAHVKNPQPIVFITHITNRVERVITLIKLL